ncbi:hypothetical protein BGW38_005037 [Lunasporangiospora selenospora]|uniref:Uncharacterized protein n=1 Tax=Lunasporangiospora selenospora TaxID=979761 RepID=A0A9P6KBM3_9FUNG|nr:hypothetical protein BGW38_005037 [Lunasporangiospora selenospora]
MSRKVEANPSRRAQHRDWKRQLDELDDELCRWLSVPVDLQWQARRRVEILGEIQEVTDLEMEDDEVEAEGESEKVSPKTEPSRSRLKGLQVVTTMLLESPFIREKATKDVIRRAAHAGTEFTEKECTVAAHLVNQLRPYNPKRVFIDDDEAPVKHFAIMAPIVMIANQVLMIAGNSNFCRKPVPEISVADRHALYLNALSMYEVFGSSLPGHFDMYDEQGKIITNAKQIQSTQESRNILISSIFNLDVIQEECRR